jgi:Tfp pilus assembly protein PilV
VSDLTGRHPTPSGHQTNARRGGEPDSASGQYTRHSRLNRLRAEEAGVSLIELLVAMMVLTLVMTGVAYGLMQATSLARESRDREAAANLVAQALDKARGTRDFNDLLPDAWTENVNGVQFDMLQTVTVQFDDGAESPCDGSANQFWKYKNVNVSSSWDTQLLSDVVQAETVVAPRVGSFNPELGNLAVKVLDAAGGPQDGVKVMADQGQNGTTERVSFTDSQGCAFLDSLEPDTYEVTVNRLIPTPAMVDPDGANEPTQVGGVAAASTTQMAFELDTPATIDVAFPPGPPGDLAVSLGNGQIQPTGVRSQTGTGSPRSITGLFPFPSGYQLWAGDCSDADPEGVFVQAGSAVDGTIFYPPPGEDDPQTKRDEAVAVEGGLTSAATLLMAEVQLTILTSTGSPVAGAAVSALHENDFDGDGTEDEQLCTTPTSLSLGTTDAAGQLTTFMPWGQWIFTATDQGVTHKFTDPDPGNTQNRNPLRIGDPFNLVPPPPMGYGTVLNTLILSSGS